MYKAGRRIQRSVLYNARGSATSHAFNYNSKSYSNNQPISAPSQNTYGSVTTVSLERPSRFQEINRSTTFISPEGRRIPINRDDPQAWLAAVDLYLPSHLRGKNYDVSQDNEGRSHPISSIIALPSLLSSSRATTPLKLDLLSYLGVHEGRWDSVVWLVKSLLKESINDGNHRSELVRSPWQSETALSQSLDDLGRDYIRLDDEASPDQPAESFEEATDDCPDSSLVQFRHGLGEVWVSTATMILQAADLPTDDQNHKTIMSNVLKILAHLHHIDALPSTIYSYSHAKDPLVNRKPPTLYLLAYRIMTILSDSAWKAHDEQIRKEAQAVGAKDWYKGHEVPGPTMQPRVNMLGTEVWLDLVLWCCVEGGWVTEAAEIVMEMAKRKDNLRWGAVDWHSIREPTEPKLNWSAKVELEIARSRMNQIASGIAIAGQSGAPPFVEMGPRTVSQEVILALMDALSNTISPQSAENNPTMTVRFLSACRTILARSPFTLEEPLMNRSILSVVESSEIDAQARPGDLERILEMAPSQMAKTRYQNVSRQLDSSTPSCSDDMSVASIGLLHKVMHYFAVQGNLQGALRSFRKMQSLVDNNRKRYILDFAEDLKRRELEGDAGDDLISESINNLIPGVHSQIPVYVLASLLDLVTQTGQHELGEWLLYNDEVDGPLIPPSLYSEETLQPALLRFAEATANGELFHNVSTKLEAPLPPAILRVLLHCQITLGKWDAAEEIFAHFQNDPDIGLTPEDIMAVARAVLRLERTIPTEDQEGISADSQSFNRAKTLLQDILHGKSSIPRDPSKPRDYSHLRILTQIGRIIQSVPGSLSKLPLHTFGDIGRANSPETIPTEAFNILLEGVADALGSQQARQTWRLWCRPVGDKAKQAPDPDDRELVVDPSLQTLRIVMRPRVKDGKIRNKKETKLVKWAEQTCREFGLSAKEIYQELPGLVPKPERGLEEDPLDVKSD